MNRSRTQQLSLVTAAVFGAAPLAFGVVRAVASGGDLRMLWMAIIASVFAASVLVAAVGKRRTRQAVMTQATVILIVATLLAGGLGFMLGATAGPGVWAVALVLGLCLAASSVFIAVSRSSNG